MAVGTDGDACAGADVDAPVASVVTEVAPSEGDGSSCDDATDLPLSGEGLFVDSGLVHYDASATADAAISPIPPELFGMLSCPSPTTACSESVGAFSPSHSRVFNRSVSKVGPDLDDDQVEWRSVPTGPPRESAMERRIVQLEHRLNLASAALAQAQAEAEKQTRAAWLASGGRAPWRDNSSQTDHIFLDRNLCVRIGGGSGLLGQHVPTVVASPPPVTASPAAAPKTPGDGGDEGEEVMVVEAESLVDVTPPAEGGAAAGRSARATSTSPPGPHRRKSPAPRAGARAGGDGVGGSVLLPDHDLATFRRFLKSAVNQFQDPSPSFRESQSHWGDRRDACVEYYTSRYRLAPTAVARMCAASTSSTSPTRQRQAAYDPRGSAFSAGAMLSRSAQASASHKACVGGTAGGRKKGAAAGRDARSVSPGTRPTTRSGYSSTSVSPVGPPRGGALLRRASPSMSPQMPPRRAVPITTVPMINTAAVAAAKNNNNNTTAIPKSTFSKKTFARPSTSRKQSAQSGESGATVRSTSPARSVTTSAGGRVLQHGPQDMRVVVGARVLVTLPARGAAGDGVGEGKTKLHRGIVTNMLGDRSVCEVKLSGVDDAFSGDAVDPLPIGRSPRRLRGLAVAERWSLSPDDATGTDRAPQTKRRVLVDTANVVLLDAEGHVQEIAPAPRKGSTGSSVALK